MSAAVAEDLDLRWVEFSDEDETCEVVEEGGERCSLEAVVVLVFRRPCGCGPERLRACTAHRDLMSGWDYLHCRRCRGRVYLLRIEPVR